jgi:ribonuclease HI
MWCEEELFDGTMRNVRQRGILKRLGVFDTLIYTDGGSRGNGSAAQSGYGSFLVDGESSLHRAEFGNCTNNEAEYRSLIAALRYCLAQGIKNPTVRMDSALVVNQVNGSWKCKEPHLRPLLEQAQELAAQCPTFQLEWCAREEIVEFLGH